MFVLHCGIDRENPVDSARRFYSKFIIGQLEEKVRKSTSYFVLKCKVREEKRNNRSEVTRTRERKRGSIPLGISHLALNNPQAEHPHH